MILNNIQERDFEIVIGLVAPIGTDLDRVGLELENKLSAYGYQSTAIRLSKLLRGGMIPVSGATDPAISGENYYEEKMDLGDKLRRDLDSGDAVAALAVANIVAERMESQGSSSQRRRHAWILRSLKHEDEVGLLRAVYGTRFILVGVHQEKDIRLTNLEDQLKQENPLLHGVETKVQALVERDEKDAFNKLGQRVQETYSLADYFINMANDISTEVARFLSVIFGSPFETPTQDEQAMYHAYSESMRSSDPGRQVGAAVTNERGTVLSLGCNDVPVAGGGLPWVGDPDDARDFIRGSDYNKRMTHFAMAELLEVLAGNGTLNPDLSSLSSAERMKKVLEVDGLSKTRLMSLIEFGRISHAEMTAITSAAGIGAALTGSTIYTTAFPCHMCMRVIIASGIRKVVYVDPYPKSLAFDMYREALTTRPSDTGRVLVAPYWGVSANIFMRAFVSNGRDREADGKFKEVKPVDQRMKLASSDPLQGARESEEQLLVALNKRVQERMKEHPADVE